jgi:hypothetical protein
MILDAKPGAQDMARGSLTMRVSTHFARAASLRPGWMDAGPGENPN